MYMPVQQYEFEFVSDNVSLALVYDLSLAPVAANFAGTPPQGLLNVTVTNTQAVTMPNFTAAIVGSVLTLTFASALPEFDVNSLRVVYTAEFLVIL